MMDQKWLQTYREEIETFSEKIRDFQEGKLDRKDYKGCSGGMGSYAQRDAEKHMLRLRLPAGRLTLERLKFLADTVEKYQVRRIKLTTCETVQLHDLAADQVPAIMEEAAACGILCRGGGGDNPRNVMCSPLSGVQEGEAFDPSPYAAAVTDYLLSVCREIHMPRKLKIAFSNGADDSVHSSFRDMGFRAQADGTFSLRIAGGLGAMGHRMGVLVDEAVQPGEVLYYVKAMVDTFCRHGNYENRAKARTRFMQDTLGPEGLKEAFLKSVESAKAAGGLELPRLEALADVCGGEETLEHPRVIRQKQPGMYTVKYHPVGGLLPVEKPARLYAAIKDLCNAECRVGPDETLYIVNLPAAGAEKVLALTEDGAKTEFEYSVACIGATVCQQGVRDSQGLLRAAVSAVREAGIPDGALPRIRISGCPSSCAAHQAGTIGFQGGVRLEDKKPQPAFRLFLGGGDALDEARFGEAGAVILEKDIPALLVELGRAAAAQGQSWAQWSESHREDLNAIVAKYA